MLQKKLGWETFWDSVKFTWDSTFVDALGPRDAIEIKPKSNTGPVYCDYFIILRKQTLDVQKKTRQPAGKGLTSLLSCVRCFIVFCLFPVW